MKDAQSCIGLALHWVKDTEIESVFAVWAAVFALEITHAHLLVQLIYATFVFGNERLAFIEKNAQK